MARLAVSYEKQSSDVRMSRNINARNKLLLQLGRQQLVYSLTGLCVSVICIVGGVMLFAFGTIGSSTWVANVLGAESKITDAAPGAVLFVAGVLLAVVTRYAFKIKE